MSMFDTTLKVLSCPSC